MTLRRGMEVSYQMSLDAHLETDGRVIWLAVVRQPAIVWLVWILIPTEGGEVAGKGR